MPVTNFGKRVGQGEKKFQTSVLCGCEMIKRAKRQRRTSCKEETKHTHGHKGLSKDGWIEEREEREEEKEREEEEEAAAEGGRKERGGFREEKERAEGRPNG